MLGWKPPTRLVLTWHINAQWQYDSELVTEVEVRFLPDADGTTRVASATRPQRFGISSIRRTAGPACSKRSRVRHKTLAAEFAAPRALNNSNTTTVTDGIMAGIEP
jgi:hypothetical protein